MASILEWSAVAHDELGDSVLVAAPASSRPGEISRMAEVGIEAVGDVGVVGAVIGGSLLLAAGARNRFRRFRDRKNRVGDREVNERVALVFFDDRVEVRKRPLMRTAIGDLLETHSLLSVVKMDGSKINVAGTTWVLQDGHAKAFYQSLEEHSIEIRQFEPDS